MNKPDSPGPPSGRGIYVNRTLNLRSIEAIGYDMDYTLIHYRVEEWERCAYDHIKQALSRGGWPVSHLAYARGNYEEAARSYRDSLEILTRVLPEGHPGLASPIVGYGKTLLKQDRPAEAEPLLRRGLGLQRKALPTGHRKTAVTESNLGACLVRLQRYDEAERLLLDSYDAMRTNLAAGHPRTIEALKRIVALYDAWDKPDRRAEYAAKLSAALESVHPRSTLP